MDGDAWIEFQAGGRIVRRDPFELLTDLVEIDRRHGYKGGPMPQGMLEDVAIFAAKTLGVESCSRVQAMRFYTTVNTAVNNITDDLKKKLGTIAGSRTGTALTPVNGPPGNAKPGLKTLVGSTPSGI